MSSVLTIYLNAFMQSFGRNSISTCRDTGVLPTKSMVIGLILNALGHDNTSEEEKDYPEQMSNALRFATKQLYTKSSSKMVDFCVARRCDKQSDILYKEYIVGSRYNVYLEGDSSDIEKIAEALLFPKRALYSGRKCCTFSSPLCWDSKNNIPTITKNSHIENILRTDPRTRSCTAGGTSAGRCPCLFCQKQPDNLRKLKPTLVFFDATALFSIRFYLLNKVKLSKSDS